MARLYMLRRNHFPDGFLVVVGLLVARFRTLEQPIVALRVEQPLFVEARLLELVVDISGDDEIVLVQHEFQEVVVNGFRGGYIAVVVNVSAPIGPMFLFGRELMEPCCVHIGEAVFLDKIGEIFLEAFAIIVEASRGGETCACSDDHGVGELEDSV